MTTRLTSPCRAAPLALCLALLFVCLLTTGSVATAGDTREVIGVLAVDGVGRPGQPPAADLLSVVLHEDPAADQYYLRIGFLSLATRPGGLARLMAAKDGATLFPATVSLQIHAALGAAAGEGTLLAAAELRRDDVRYLPAVTEDVDKTSLGQAVVFAVRDGDRDAIWLPIAAKWVAGATAADPLRITVTTRDAAGRRGDQVIASYPADKAYEAHCAFLQHGNQGLGYSDVFTGRWDDPAGSGFDEALEIHESTSVPGNFHLSGTLQTAAQWQYNNGDPLDFNGWLAAGVSAGWAGMISSAYAQHIMPFVNDEMNDWAVNIMTQMVDTRYGYYPRVAWVPERVWLNTSGYPSAGVNDWIGDNWDTHGVWGVVLDDDVHLSGHDNHQIHFLSGDTLRLIPRDRAFTGNIVGGNGQASLDILTGLAGSGFGEFRLAVFAEDWEAIAEWGSWETATPDAKETYDWFIQKCADESSWLHTWKLADAIGNPNFNGTTLSPTPGTYWEIGGTDGYGGGDNGWYTHWAGFIPYANGGDGDGNCAGGGGNCKDYGTLWSDAYNALVAAPDNNVSQAGWYVLMTNLHETAWHDGMGGPISGWEHKYSAHMKNAMVYAEASHWANDEYATTTAAYFSDIDNDGYDECIVHNDRLFAVFEGIGGRATHLFVKGTGGLNDTAIGVDNAYWSGTEGDFNDDNHVGAFSDVGPNHQHDTYDIQIVSATGPMVHLRLTRAEVTKDIMLTTGDSHLDVTYHVGPATHWIQSGFSPSLVDLVWNAELYRIWVTDQAYMGQRNPNTGIAAAWIVGAGGATHQKDITGTIMKGDEIRSNGVFQCRLFAGLTSAPDGMGEIAELRALATSLIDTIGPAPLAGEYYPVADRLRVTFDQEVNPVSVDPTGFGVDEDGDGIAEVTLGAGTTVSETAASFVLTFDLDPTTAAALAALSPSNLLLLMDAGAVLDLSGIGNLQVTEADQVPVDVVSTQVTIDGRLEPTEWSLGFTLSDSNDSAWTATNEIDALYASWDSVYLYVALDGVVSNNSWLIYFDVDPDSLYGETDLTAIDAWERGATFSASGFRADFQYGCYQHQGAFDSDSFFEILSPTTTSDRSGEILSAFDSFHVHGDEGGSELAIPWHTLYGLGNDAVPPGARISIVASICWDPEPDGELGGDSAPSNLVATLPEIDNVWTLTVDSNGDGKPDRLQLSPVPELPVASLRLLPAVPNPFNPATTISFDVPVETATPVVLTIYDVKGRRVATLLEKPLPAGRHSVVWNGRDAADRVVAAGTYICCLRHRGQVVARPLSLIK